MIKDFKVLGGLESREIAEPSRRTLTEEEREFLEIYNELFAPTAMSEEEFLNMSEEDRQAFYGEKYPTKKEKEQVKEIKVGYSTEKETKELDGGELNLSEYPNLEKVIINGDYLKTKLTSLEVSNCSQLTFLDVYDNELTHLDLNNCAKLKELYCEKNSLTKLDLNPQIKLKELIINSNNFSEPDLSFLKLIKKGFSGREKWLNIGFTPQDGYFCVWLRNIKQLTLEQAKSNEQQLRGEFNNVSLITKQWLEKYYPSKETRRFTLKKVGDPVFVNIEETIFPTKKGDKTVKKIGFFPSSSASEKDIKNALQMSGDEVKELTFEIEIDGSEIEAEEPPQNNNLNASSSASAGNFTTFAGSSDNEILTLRKYKLTDIKVKTESQQRQNTSSSQDNTEKKSTGTGNQENKSKTNKEDTETGNDKKPTGNTGDTPSPKPSPEPDQPPKKSEPAKEKVDNAKDDLKNSRNSDDEKKMEEALKNARETTKNSSDEDLKREKEETEKKLGEKNKEKVREIIRDEVNEVLQENEIKPDDLSPSPTQAQAMRTEIFNDVGVKTLTKLISEVEQALKSGDKKKIENVVQKLQEFANSQIDYKKQAYQAQKDKVQQLLEKAKNQQQFQQKDKNDSFFRPNNPVM
ncbi:10491_t:CDS:2 [Gigaspora margarita]|uniref:10491_t:CDS:1 n=1 Tax=Gigaspora margarita TaxID=4874 RepID=A0ABM8VWP4_GIGMA|nr:10491_t:CDS:2 [Gigaspora margarita]